MAEEKSPDKKVFSYGEAVAMLPEVRRLTNAAHQQVTALAAHAGDSGATTQEVEELVGEVIRDWAQALVAMGLEVKGLWLVDWDNGPATTAGSTRRTASTTTTPTRRDSAAGCGFSKPWNDSSSSPSSSCSRWWPSSAGSVGFFAIGAFFEALEEPAVLGKRIEAAFRKPVRPAQPIGPDHYYHEYWKKPGAKQGELTRPCAGTSAPFSISSRPRPTTRSARRPSSSCAS